MAESKPTKAAAQTAKTAGEAEAPPRASASTKAKARKQRAVEAGGHTIMADVDPATPAEIVTCSVCGSDDCVHMQADTGQAWRTTETPPEREPSDDRTFYPDETVGPRSTETPEV